MIINNTKDRVIIVPAAEHGILIDKVTLLPGNNEVDKKLWEAARKNVISHIRIGVIKEKHAEVKEKEIKLKDEKGKLTGEIKKEMVLSVKEFNKLTANEAEEIIINTFNIETLEKWKKKTKYDEIRTLISNKIDEVKKYGNKKKDKDKE